MPRQKPPKEPQYSAKAEPFKVVKGAEETGGDVVRIEALLHPSLDASQHGPPRGASRDASQTSPGLGHRRWLADAAGEHLHPRQEEHIEVLSGQLRVALDGNEQILTEGEEITLPPKIPHRHWNASRRPARIALEHRPAFQSEQIFRTLYRSAQDGNANEEGSPHFLQVAVLQHQYPNHAYMTDLPVLVQKGLFTVLGPIGRLLGYRASPSQDVPSEDSSPATS